MGDNPINKAFAEAMGKMAEAGFKPWLQEIKPLYPDCAVCGQPFHKHSGGTPNACPIIATYRPKP